MKEPGGPVLAFSISSLLLLSLVWQQNLGLAQTKTSEQSNLNPAGPAHPLLPSNLPDPNNYQALPTKKMDEYTVIDASVISHFHPGPQKRPQGSEEICETARTANVEAKSAKAEGQFCETCSQNSAKADSGNQRIAQELQRKSLLVDELIFLENYETLARKETAPSPLKEAELNCNKEEKKLAQMISNYKLFEVEVFEEGLLAPIANGQIDRQKFRRSRALDSCREAVHSEISILKREKSSDAQRERIEQLNSLLEIYDGNIAKVQELKAEDLYCKKSELEDQRRVLGNCNSELAALKKDFESRPRVKSEFSKRRALLLSFSTTELNKRLNAILAKKPFNEQSHQPCDLSAAEAWALTAYTGAASEWVNPALRTAGKDPHFEEATLFARLIARSFQKLKPYKGYVKRGSDLPKDVLAAHAVGRVIPYSAFTSSGIDYNFGGEHKFVIESESGRYIGGLSKYSKEGEVLFLPGTLFRIMGEKDKNHFVMQEVQSPIEQWAAPFLGAP